MTDRAFRGYVDHSYANPANWMPTGVPQAGDTAGIVMSSAVATGPLPANLTLSVHTLIFGGRSASLTLQNVTVPVSSLVESYTFLDTYEGSFPSSLSFAGTVDNEGTLVFDGGVQTVTLPSGTTLENRGTIDINGAAPIFSAGGTGVSFSNDGLIRIVNTADQAGQLAVFSNAIGGTGTVTVSLHAALEFGGAVGSGQTVAFTGGTGADASVRIDVPTLFAGTIGGFSVGDTILLSNMTASSANYVAAGASAGMLQLFNGSTQIASFAFSGTYTTGNFVLGQSGSDVTITTNVTNPSTGSTVPLTSTGLFRFFDTADGSHFFTASVAERDTVLVGRPDLVQEVNGFGAVATTDAGTESVYRFFDTAHGTHFFTASTAERDQVIATRSDLVYEPSATFLEHATAQAGDVAVYRLFSTSDGTHLYTASASELSGLTTPGGAGYRADLVPEGVSFFAPSGTYT